METNRLVAHVLDRRRLTPQVERVLLGVPADYTWSAGQYLSVLGEKKQAYYSIASAAKGDGLLELAVGESDDAPAFEPGAEVLVSRPDGLPAIPTPKPLAPSTTIVLIGMGTGIAPLRAVIQEHAGRLSGRRMTLLQGSRNQESRLFFEEFMHFSQLGLLDYRPVLSQPAAPWEGLSGRVQDHVAAVPRGADYYAACGNRAMVEDVTRVLHTLGERLVFAQGY